MKRVAVIAIFMAVMASLFAFPVYAANPSVFNDYSASISSNGVQFLLRAIQFKSSSLGTSMLPGGMESVFYVTLEIRNSNTQAALIRPPQFDITITEDKTISHIYSYSSDLLLERQTWFKVVPSSDFSYASSGSELIVVPPETSLYFIGAICTTAQLDQTGQTIQDAGLRGVNFVENDYYVAKGNYPYGSAVDLSPVTAYLNNIEDDIDDISTAITDIIDAITYDGSYVSSNLGSAESLSYDTTIDYVRTICRIYRGRNTYSEVDVYYNEGDDTSHVVGTVRIPLSIYIQVNATQNVEAYYITYLNNLFINEATTFHIDTFISDIFDVPLRMQLRNLVFKIKDDYISSNNRRVIPKGNHYLVLTGYMEYPAGLTVSLPDMTVNTAQTFWNNSVLGAVSGYYPLNEYTILKDLYLAYSSVNGLDDIDDTADDIKDKSESAHTQEQSYFTQNAQAIQQTGLSNYRFNGDQENGIGSVSHDFTLLWNALGGFNSVYIFSLTLSLALMILRHAPGAIKSSRRNKEE